MGWKAPPGAWGHAGRNLLSDKYRNLGAAGAVRIEVSIFPMEEFVVRKFAITLAAAAAAILTVPPAAAQHWQSINQRQARLNHRINQGVRTGALTWREARRLRHRSARLAWLEQRYRRSGHGLSAWERRDLNRRFDGLSRSIRAQRHDRQRYR